MQGARRQHGAAVKARVAVEEALRRLASYFIFYNTERLQCTLLPPHYCPENGGGAHLA